MDGAVRGGMEESTTRRHDCRRGKPGGLLHGGRRGKLHCTADTQIRLRAAVCYIGT